jgi:hypothetical protein
MIEQLMQTLLSAFVLAAVTGFTIGALFWLLEERGK